MGEGKGKVVEVVSNREEGDRVQPSSLHLLAFLRLSSSPVVWSGPLLSLASHPVTTVDD